MREAGDSGTTLVLRPEADGSPVVDTGTPVVKAPRGLADDLATRSRPLVGVSLCISPGGARPPESLLLRVLSATPATTVKIR